ncbi:hypothetical protein BT96DRAFT_937193 [Gymnopus androsaceus JB14]|uniref:Uncharacterized protein n=1 Tax=Gymnopus androsaceus JB14 TaxID=1447944 RepID=A0A6A4HYW0_9AGAR|nr:hypothetical protein BT96DRAFT_937193 [Gymnopus androsaceus JB14]
MLQHSSLRVNTDQTQTIYQQGTKATWNQKGDRQVPAVGIDKKQVFTLVPSISASGKLLPFQAIYQGATPASCPNCESPFYNEAQRLGFQLEPSKSNTYWSTMATMKSLVNEIIAPYFARKKDKLEIEDLDNQFSIWKIDCCDIIEEVTAQLADPKAKEEFQLCCTTNYNLSQESLTKASTICALSMLKTTHPSLHQKLVLNDTAPDPVTKHHKKVPAPLKITTTKDDSTQEAEDETVELTFMDTGNFDDSCDIPLGAVIEHVLLEGKETIAGVVEQEDEAEDPDAEVPVVMEVKEKEEGQMLGHDWEWTNNNNVSGDEGMKKRRKKMGKRA